jgi:hypothetical protein
MGATGTMKWLSSKVRKTLEWSKESPLDPKKSLQLHHHLGLGIFRSAQRASHLYLCSLNPYL